MPLNPKASVWQNAHEMMLAGHPRDQSFAAAYRLRRDQRTDARKRTAARKRKQPVPVAHKQER